MPTAHSATAPHVAVGERAERQVAGYPPLMLYGALSMALGFALQTCAGLWAFCSVFTGTGGTPHSDIPLISYSAIPIIVGVFLVAAELAFQLPKKRAHRRVVADTIPNRDLTVILTAYNDELSIGPAVRDFLDHPGVRRVLVVDNNSSDRTGEVAAHAGAIVIREETPGYGSCVYRGFEEALKYTDTELILLCEGDMTFRAFDIDKFLAYIPHASIVNGTRIVEQLRDRDTQLSTFIYYGNFAVGKLLELKHIGRGTFTDVGTTYKLPRRGAGASPAPSRPPGQPRVQRPLPRHGSRSRIRHRRVPRHVLRPRRQEQGRQRRQYPRAEGRAPHDRRHPHELAAAGSRVDARVP